MKMCSRCDTNKPLAEFRRDATRRDGFSYWCTPCKSADRRAHYLANRPRVLIESSRWARSHRTNKNAAAKRFAERNPGSWKAQNQKRRAMLRGAPGRGVTRAEWDAILDHFGHRCAYCAATGNMDMDHIEPLSGGGAHDVDNVAPACGYCNGSKNRKPLIVWLATRAA